MKPKLILLALCLLLVTVSACNAPPTGGTVNYALVGEPELLNPLLPSNDAALTVEDCIFQGLLSYDENLQLRGQLAQSWETSSDNLELTFYLRDDVIWHDGTPFTAGDVEFTFATLVADEKLAGDFSLLEDIEVLDEHTIKFTVSEVQGSFLANFTQGIVPRHIFDPEIAQEDLSDNAASWQPVGTGPFVFGAWVDNQYLTLERNEDYYGASPYLDGLCFKFYPDMTSALSALETGEVDFLEDVPPELAEELEPLAETHSFHIYNDEGYQALIFNFRTDAPWQDSQVRSAMAYALDRDKIVEEVLDGYGVVMDSPQPPTSWIHSEDVSHYGYDPALARLLLNRAGWLQDSDGWRYKDGERLTCQLTLREDSDFHITVAQQVLTFWQDVGIEVELNELDLPNLLGQHVYPGNFDLVLMGFSIGPDPDVYDFFHTTAVKKGMNPGKYSNDEVDRLLVKGRNTMDIETRRQTYSELQIILSEDLPYIFLFSKGFTAVVSNDVDGITMSPQGPVQPEKWYMAK